MDIDRNKLDETLTKELFSTFEIVLDYAQVAVAPSHWPALRGKILRALNNCLRNLREEFTIELTKDK